MVWTDTWLWIVDNIPDSKSYKRMAGMGYGKIVRFFLIILTDAVF